MKMDEQLQKQTGEIIAAVQKEGIYKVATCDAPNWDATQHTAMLTLYMNGVKDLHINYRINHGVYDWFVLPKTAPRPKK